MTPDRDFLCSCCSAATGIRYDFIVVSARSRRDDRDMDMDAETDAVVSQLQRTTLLDQAAILSKLRHAHR